MPIAPGTAGAAEGVAVFLAVVALRLDPANLLLMLIALNVGLYFIGVWASGRTCKMTGLEDPRIVVIDEISGQLIALSPVALSFSIWPVIIGFLLFRLFDIFKPYPIRKLERLPGGFGVMTDDVLAGIYAATLLWLGQLARLI